MNFEKGNILRIISLGLAVVTVIFLILTIVAYSNHQKLEKAHSDDGSYDYYVKEYETYANEVYETREFIRELEAEGYGKRYETQIDAMEDSIDSMEDWMDTCMQKMKKIEKKNKQIEKANKQSKAYMIITIICVLSTGVTFVASRKLGTKQKIEEVAFQES